MSVTEADILKLYERDRDARDEVLDERISDLHFARWGQSDDTLSEICTTEFQGQYDIISRERKRLQAEFRENEIEVKFRNKSDDNDESDDLMQGKYRTDRRLSKSKQCFQIAQDDAIDCGYGAWRLVTIEEDEENSLNTNLEIRREPIPEAIRKVFWDSNSKLYDKSDAQRCSVLHTFDEDGYKAFLELNDIDEKDIDFISFDGPYQSIYELYFDRPFRYPFFNKGENKLSILEYYSIEPIRTTYYQYMDAQNQPFILEKADAKEQGLGEPIAKRTKIQKKCFKYLFNGSQILKRTEVPGGHIPIIPAYGERNFVNGVENFYGIVKAARDPQTLINSAFNYLASMMMFSPIPKPEFDPREIEGHEHLYENANNHTMAYHLRNKAYVDADGKQFDFSTPTYTMPPAIPPAIAQLIASVPEVMNVITNPGVTAEAAKTSISGVALQQVREEIGVMSYIYLDNWGESMRRDGEVYSAMASAVYDIERRVVVTNQDGTTTEEVINQNVIDFEQFPFELKQVNKIYDQRFDVHFDIGPSYQSRRDATQGNLKELYQTLDPNDPMRRIVMLTILSQESGEGLDDIKKTARYDLLSQGLPGYEPQTEEEEEFIAQLEQQRAQQQQQPDPASLLAQAENKKGDAALMKEQREAMNDQADNANDAAKVQVDAFEAETSRFKVQVDAQKAGAEINLKDVQTVGEQIENAQKTLELQGKALENRLKQMTAFDLLNAIQ